MVIMPLMKPSYRDGRLRGVLVSFRSSTHRFFLFKSKKDSTNLLYDLRFEKIYSICFLILSSFDFSLYELESRMLRPGSQMGRNADSAISIIWAQDRHQQLLCRIVLVLALSDFFTVDCSRPCSSTSTDPSMKLHATLNYNWSRHLAVTRPGPNDSRPYW